MSEAPCPQALPDSEAIDVAVFAIWAAVQGLPRDKAQRRLWKMEGSAHDARNEALGRANVYALRGRGTVDQMDAARRSKLDRANVLLAALDVYRGRAFPDLYPFKA